MIITQLSHNVITLLNILAITIMFDRLQREKRDGVLFGLMETFRLLVGGIIRDSNIKAENTERSAEVECTLLQLERRG